MRLTLRTLLAYLDDVLPPAEAKNIGEQVAQSEIAKSLIHRIRDVMRRRRLAVPALSGSGVGIEPNAVAEYIDGLLPPEGMADIEKVCLDSDVHLAEVASCHQILVLAVGEPVTIPGRLRERMHGLGPSAARVDVPVIRDARELASAGVASILASAVASRPQPVVPFAPPSSPEEDRAFSGVSLDPRSVSAKSGSQPVPEYLRPKTDIRRWFAYAALAVVLAAWGYLTFSSSPFGQGGGFGGDRTRDVAQAAAVDKAVVPKASGVPRLPGEAPVESPVEPAVEASAGPKVAAASTGVPGGEAKSGLPPEAGNAGGREFDQVLEDGAPPYRKKPQGNAPAPGEKAGSSLLPAEDDEGEAPPAATPPAVLPPQPLGKYVSTEGIALLFQTSDEAWHPIRAGTELFPGADLASPQPFEATVEVEGGLVTLLPGTAVAWRGAGPAGGRGVTLRNGKLLVRATTVGHQPAGPLVLTVELGGSVWQAELSPEAFVGFEAAPPLPTTFEQAATAEGGLAAIHVTSGRVKLRTLETDARPIELKGPASLELPIPQPSGDQVWREPKTTWRSPDWMSSRKAGGSSRSLATLFEKHFASDEPAEMTLSGVTKDPNPRLSELATGCLALIGDAGTLLSVLHATKHEESRQTAILGLRAWLLADTAHRETLQAELRKRYRANDIDVVYRLLWGYRLQDAQDKTTSARLVELLSSDEPSIRALAFHHVKSLTGRDFGYHVDGSDLQRSSALKQWRQHLVKNQGCLIKPDPDAGEE